MATPKAAIGLYRIPLGGDLVEGAIFFSAICMAGLCAYRDSAAQVDLVRYMRGKASCTWMYQSKRRFLRDIHQIKIPTVGLHGQGCPKGDTGGERGSSEYGRTCRHNENAQGGISRT